MQRIINDQTPVHILPTIRHGVPLPKTGKGRAPKPLNPTLLKMEPGQSFVVTGEAACKTMTGDVGRARDARKAEVAFVTRNLSAKLDPETFEQYPAHALGVWCVAAKRAEVEAPTGVGYDPVQAYIDGQTSDATP